MDHPRFINKRSAFLNVPADQVLRVAIAAPSILSKEYHMLRSSCIALALGVGALHPVAQAAGPAIDTSTIEGVTGLKGTYNKALKTFSR